MKINFIIYFYKVYCGDNWSIKTKDEGVAAYNKCVDNMGISVADIIKIEKLTDPLNRLITKCVYIEMGFYDSEGFKVDRIVKQFGGGHDLQESVEKCVPQNSEDSSDVQIIQFEVCFKTNKLGGYAE